MSIPVFFEPVMHHNPRTDTDHLIVDGGMLSNFPVWLFDAKTGEPPRWPTFGMLLVEGEPKVEVGHRVEGEEHGVVRGSVVDYVKALASTMMEAHDRLYVEKATFVRTIPIPTIGVSTTEFGITPERVRRALRVRPQGRAGLPRPLGLRGLQGRVPQRQGPLPPRGDRYPPGWAAISATFARPAPA